MCASFITGQEQIPTRKIPVIQPEMQRGLVPVKFQIDPSASRFTVQAFATGLLSSFGHNPTIGMRDYDGEMNLTQTFLKMHPFE